MRRQLGNIPLIHDYNVPFSFGFKKIGYILIIIGLFLVIIGKDDSMILLNASLFWVNFSQEKIENNRIFRVRYQSLKMTIFSLAFVLLALSILSRLISDVNKYNIEPFKILLFINILYLLFFQFYKLLIKE